MTKEEFATNLINASNVQKYLADHNVDESAHPYILQLIDEKIEAIPTPDVSGQIAEHNVDESAHPSILQLIDEKIADSAQSDWNVNDSENPAYIHNKPFYLEEVINEELLDYIKNPFSKGNCDVTESRVDMIDGYAYTTLKCGKYLIDKEKIKDVNDIKIYKVSDWSSKKIKGDNVEKKTFYNCKKDGKVLS